jgi:hypothetical protein
MAIGFLQLDTLEPGLRAALECEVGIPESIILRPVSRVTVRAAKPATGHPRKIP